MSKLRFYRGYMVVWVPAESYSIYNGIYTSKELIRELHEKLQWISHSGVGCHHQNGLTYNTINNMFRISRTMVIHTALSWNDSSDRSLCPVYMAHSVHLHNHNPHISSGMYPEEFCTRFKSSYIYLYNSCPCVLPAYVLEPRLQYGNKLNKWMLIYIRDQCLVASPLYYITVGMVSNL